jgi:hypothetical protein
VWVYLLNGSDTVRRDALGPSVFGGQTYQLLRDRYPTVQYDTLGNPHDTFVYDMQYVRSDANNIYQLATENPVTEVIQLEKSAGSNWTYYDSISSAPLIIRNDYSTLEELPNFVVGNSTYHHVLKIRITQSIWGRPNSNAVSVMSYFAKGIGQVATSDSAGTKLNFTLASYHLN